MIDVRTVYISQCISYVICVLVMASLWRQNRTQSPMFVLWLLNSLLQLTAAIAILARLVIPEPISIMLGNPLIVAGTLLQYVGLERYLEKRSSQRLNYALVLTYLCLHTWFTFGQPNLQGRILIFTVAMSALTAQAAWLTLHRVDPELRRVTRFLGITYAGMLLLSVLRLYTVVAVPPEGSSLFNSGIFSALAIMAFQMLFIAQTFSLVVMVNGRLLLASEQEIQERRHFEAALQASESKFGQAFLASPLAMLITRAEDGRITEVNPAFEHMVNYSRTEAVEKTTLELALWENVQDRHRFYADLSLHGSINQQEFRFRRQNGSILIGLLSARLFTLEGEAMVLSVINDITEQRANERAQRLTQFLMEQTVDEIYFIREDATLQYVNEAACQRLGYSRDELLTMTVQDVDPNSSAASWGSHWQALKQTRSRTFETAHRTRGGRLYPVEVHVNYIEHEGVGYNCSICRDITERKRAEEALRASEENYRSLVETSDSAIAALNRDGQLLYANPVCLRIWEDPDLVGKTLYNLFPQEVADRFLTVIRRVIDEQIVDLNELQLTIRGAAMWFRVSMTPIKNSDGSVKALLLNAIDTTERKRTEAALAAAKEAAETANRAKSQFLANMSHELRTPLNAILGFSEIMAQDANLSADQQENLAIINRSGDHLLSLINDVLDMAKIEAGRTVLQEHTFDLHQLLADLRDMFRLRATAKGLALRVTWTADVPQFVCADASKLRQVLINLLSNAIKFTTTGSVTLTVAQMTAAAGDQLYFVVQDTGPGIPLEDQEAVFEPFVQSASGRLASEGTGLGLPISRQFVRLMGGELTVASAGAPGQGSCFTMALPLRVADNDGAPAQWLGGPHAIGPAPGQPDYRLLVAEDDAASRRLLAEMLTELGFTVRTATNGQEAIQVWAEWQPHMIWMDMRMPVMDGHAATRRIKETAQGQQTVIVAVSASVLDGQRTAVLAAGCDDFVAKPIRAEAVVAQLVKHLGVRFIYTEGAPTDGAASLAGASAFDLTALPTGWISQVRHAAVVADARRLHELAAELADAQPVLASALREWVADFDYAAVLLAVAHDPKEEHDGI